MRTEGDSWDITTSVGSTALFVATARALEAQKSDPLVVDPYAEAFCRAVGGSWADVLDGKLPDHKLKSTDFGEHFVNFQGARTKYFDEYFRRAAAAGARQVVILAAGLDSRAYRLPWPDGTTVFELDRPQVLDFKREVLASHGAQPRALRREIAVDLRDDWPQALRDSGFDAAKVEEERAAIAEGAEEHPFFQLVYNERCAPAAEWFGERGWTAVATLLNDYLEAVGRPVPGPESEAGPMFARNTLVSAARV